MGILDSPGKSIANAKDFLSNPFSRNPKNSLRGDDFPDGFQIFELDPPRERLSLVKHLMPKQPFIYGGTQRHIRETYAGKSEPVVHILGADENDLIIRGRLWDKKFNEINAPGGNYGIAENLQQQLDEFRIRGNLLKIRMGEFVRFAFLVATEFPLRTRGDIDYVLTFLIVGFSPPLRSQFAGLAQQSPNESNKALNDLLDAFNANFSQIPDEVPASLGDILRDGIGTVANAINEVTTFIDSVFGVVEDVNSAIIRAIGLIKNAQTTIQQYKRRIGQIGFGFSQGTSFAGVSPSSRYTSYSFITGSLTATLSFASLLERMLKQFEELRKTTPLARHLIRENDTLQKLALRFYDDDQQWKRIYDHNDLTSTDLVVGNIIEIPQEIGE